MRLLIIAILTANIQVASAQVPVPSKKEMMAWSATQSYEVSPHDTAYAFYHFRLKSVALVKSNVILWSVLLPERMTNYDAGIIYDRIPVDDRRNAYRTRPEEININNFTTEFLTCPELISKETIAIADRSGILILARENGKILLDIEYAKNYESTFYVDTGTFKITHKKGTYKGLLNHGAEFIAQCGQYLLHFNGSELFLFDRRALTVERILYDSEKHLIRPGLFREMSISHLSFMVNIQGRVFVN